MSTPPGAVAFDSRELRSVLGAFVTGVTVITTIDADGKAHGLTANSFSSVSLDPPLVLWSQSLKAPSHPVFRDADRFVVNILAEDQVDVSNRFARSSPDKFAGIATTPGIGGVPLLHGCSAWLECRRIEALPGGDHVVFLGQVERIERSKRPPLVFGGGRYMVAQPHDSGTSLVASGANIARLQAVRLATRSLIDLSDELDESLGLGVWGNQGPTMVRWEESSNPLSENLRTGLVLPVLTSATGLAFAAWLPPELTEPFIDIELATAGLASMPTEMARQLSEIRTSGVSRMVATSLMEDPYGAAVSALSVPVFGADGAMVLAITAVGEQGKLDTGPDGKVVTGLKRCAAALSQRLAALAPADGKSPGGQA